MKILMPTGLLLCGAFLMLLVTHFLETSPVNVNKDDVLSQQVPQDNISQNNSKNISDFEQWRLECDDTSKRCQLFQQLTFNQKTPDGKVHQALALNILLYKAYNKKDNKAVTRIRFVTPLGLDLQTGMAMRVDDGKEFQLPFQSCSVDGCLTDFILGEDVIIDMKKGKLLKVAYRAPNIEPVTLGVSLKGFTKSYEALKEKQASYKSR